MMHLTVNTHDAPYGKLYLNIIQIIEYMINLQVKILLMIF